MTEKYLPSVFKRADGAPEHMGQTAAPGDERCSATYPYKRHSSYSRRCELKAKDVYSPEVHAELQEIAATSLDEFDVNQLGLTREASHFLNFGFCGRHSPERILRNNITVRIAKAKHLAAQKAVLKARHTEEEALKLRVEAALGRTLGGYAISLFNESSVLVGKQMFEELLAKLEARA